MSPDQLQGQLQALISGWESECAEFKAANDNFSTSGIGKYFSALRLPNACSLALG